MPVVRPHKISLSNQVFVFPETFPQSPPRYLKLTIKIYYIFDIPLGLHNFPTDHYSTGEIPTSQCKVNKSPKFYGGSLIATHTYSQILILP